MTLKQKNTILPILVVTIMCVLMMVLCHTPLSIAILPLVVIGTTVYNISKRKALGKLFLFGFIATAIYIGILCLLSYLARDNAIILSILKFPFHKSVIR